MTGGYSSGPMSPTPSTRKDHCPRLNSGPGSGSNATSASGSCSRLTPPEAPRDQLRSLFIYCNDPEWNIHLSSCVFMYVHIHIYMYIYICVCVYVYIHTYIYIYVCVCAYLYVYVCAHLYLNVCVCVYIYIYKYI